MRSVGALAQLARDVGDPKQSQQSDGEVAQAGHDLGAVAGAGLGAVFMEGDIALR